MNKKHGLRWMDKEDAPDIYTTECYSAIKKEWNNFICSNMDGPRDYHSKCSKKAKDKYHMILHICGI